jgi:signal transduction histidine kinase
MIPRHPPDRVAPSAYGGSVRTPPGRTAVVVDAALAAVFALVCLLYALIGGWPDVVVVLAFAAALAVRRVSPGWSLVIAWGAAVTQMLLLRDVQPADLAVFGVLYATSAYGTRTVKWCGLGSAGVGAVVATVYLALVKPALDAATIPGDSGMGRLLWTGILFAASLTALVLAWTVGLLVRTVRQSREQQRRAELDRREREHAEYRYVVEQERNRIARDMHDVVAHSLAVVIAQADGARFAAASRPEQASAALGTIAGVARSALGDVRLLLAELRHREGGAPQPAVDDLDALIAQVRDAGLDVRFVERGERTPLGAGHQIAVYRIVQEGLTNALRHGDAAQPVELQLDWTDGGLDIRLENAMRADAAAHPAAEAVAFRHGIPGMRERAQLAGGTFDAQAGDDGRFRVHATIPAKAAA